jgi:gamma-glutamyl phosphate reductase
VPPDLQTANAAALAALPRLVAAASAREWDNEFLSCALAAVAAAKGSTDVAEAVLELTPAVAADVMEWQESR